MNLQSHHTDNHDRVDHLIYRIKSLAEALDDAIDDVPELCTNGRTARIVRTILATILRDAGAAEKAQAQVWAGFGRHTESLTPEEIAEARGENPEVAV